MTAPRFPTLARVASACLMAWPVYAAPMPFEPRLEVGRSCSLDGPWYCTETAMLRASFPTFLETLACDVKSAPCTEAVYVIPTEAEGYPGLWDGTVFRAAEAAWPVYGNTGWLVAGSGGGSYRSGGASRSDSVDRVERHFLSVTHTVHYPGCGCGCCETDEPPEIPIPASLPLLAGALALIAFCKRR